MHEYFLIPERKYLFPPLRKIPIVRGYLVRNEEGRYTIGENNYRAVWPHDTSSLDKIMGEEVTDERRKEILREIADDVAKYGNIVYREKGKLPLYIEVIWFGSGDMRLRNGYEDE